LIAKHETWDIYTNKLLSEGVIDPTFVNGLEKSTSSDLAMNLKSHAKRFVITRLCRMNGKDLQEFLMCKCWKK
jgi:hypothetical protein